MTKFQFLFLAPLITIIHLEVVLSNHSHVSVKCEDLLSGVTSFNVSSALGTWYRVHRSRGGVCAQITTVKRPERDALKERFEDHIMQVDWDEVSLKLVIPCKLRDLESRTYYLQPADSPGRYTSIPVHSDSEEDMETPATIALNPTAMKILDGQYLVILDCDHRFVFVMSRDPDHKIPDTKDQMLKKLLEAL